MNWPLIVLLSCFGVIMGAGSLVEAYASVGVWISIVIYLFCAWMIGLRAPKKLFLHGFLVGVIAGAIGLIFEIAFWDSFMDANPKIAEAMAKIPEGVNIDIKRVTLMSAPFGVLIWGVILGALSLLAGKVLKKTPAPAVEPPSQPPTAPNA
jgi:hypothetical protein